MSDRTSEPVVVKQEPELQEVVPSLGSPKTQHVDADPLGLLLPVKLEPDTDDFIKQEIDIGPTVLYKPLSYPVPQKRSRSTNRQTEVLVELMVAHSDLALARFGGPMVNERKEVLWCQIAAQVSAHGPLKTSTQVKTTWRDLKKMVRAKNAQIRSLQLATGNRDAPVPKLTDTELKVLSLIDPESSGGVVEAETGLEEEPKSIPVIVAVDSVDLMEDVVEEIPINVEAPLASTSCTTPRQPPKKRICNMDDVAKGYVDLQAETNATLKEISKTFKAYTTEKFEFSESKLALERELNELKRESNKLQLMKINMLAQKNKDK